MINVEHKLNNMEKNMKKIIPLLLLIPFLSQAENVKKEINAPRGAFGIEFGQTLSTLKVINQSKTKNGIIYQIKVPKPFKGYNVKDYYVFITPKTKKIYSIIGNKNITKNECVIEKNNIVSILENKYGKSKLLDDENSWFEFDNIDINVVCHNDENGNNLTIMYNNVDLYHLAEKEKKENLIKMTDSSML